MKKNLGKIAKWLCDQLLWLVVGILGIFLYVMFALWICWRTAKLVFLRKPIVIEEFPVEVVFYILYYPVLSLLQYFLRNNTKNKGGQKCQEMQKFF